MALRLNATRSLSPNIRLRGECNYINRGVHSVRVRTRVRIRIRIRKLGLELGLGFRVRI